MAIVKAPALSIDASGNVGGICYSKWRGLQIAKAAWTGTVPNTPDQQVIQGYMTTASQAWSGTLSENEREAWSRAAQGQVRVSRVKTTYIPTGYQYFMQLNIQRLRQAAGILSLPPVAMIPYGFTSISIEWNLAKVWVEVRFLEHLYTPPPAFQGEIWKAGPYDNAGRHPLEGEYRFLSFTALVGVYKDAAVVSTKYYWYKLRWIEENGRVGNWFEKQVYIT